MYQPQKRELTVALTFGLSALFLYVTPAWAEFTLNWTSDTGNPVFSGTSVTQTDDGGNDQLLPNQTPFVYERVLDGTTPYYHLIVGDPESGFAQEVYIQAGYTAQTGGNCRGPVSCAGIADPIGPSVSASGGDTAVSFGFEGNGFDPLSSDAVSSGNASGNPSRVQMRQLVTDGDLTVDFVKDTFAEKPSITNTIDAADLNATIVIDSTGNPLTSAATASVVTNTTELLGSNLPPDVSSPNGGPSSVRFDMATDAQNSHVTAGMYSYTPGSGPGGSSGTYTYSEGSANINPDWGSSFDTRETNPWSYPDNRPTP
ncbi:MAG: hypothetical protein IT488_03100 [Gammaproteobacteria bacterium]|nr:hypothetical protein [Gammaproteobacteria bacterium]